MINVIRLLTAFNFPDEPLPRDEASYTGLGDVSFFTCLSPVPSREYRSPFIGD